MEAPEGRHRIGRLGWQLGDADRFDPSAGENRGRVLVARTIQRSLAVAGTVPAEDASARSLAIRTGCHPAKRASGRLLTAPIK